MSLKTEENQKKIFVTVNELAEVYSREQLMGLLEKANIEYHKQATHYKLAELLVEEGFELSRLTLEEMKSILENYYLVSFTGLMTKPEMINNILQQRIKWRGSYPQKQN
jgi:hypothetical protein